MKSVIGTLLKVIGFVTILCVIIGGIGLFLAGYWLQAQDKIEKGFVSDAIVVLGGSYFRPLHAADLYNRGVAPVIYVTRPIQKQYIGLLKGVGVDLPPQEEIFRRLLVKRGVPDGAIRFFGESVINTAQEAEALKKVLGNKARALVLVTSPYHVRRAKLVFEDAFPGSSISVTGTPYEAFPKKWWSARESALKVVTEISKIIFYLAGGCFKSNYPVLPKHSALLRHSAQEFDVISFGADMPRGQR